jgi:hypothetical protein
MLMFVKCLMKFGRVFLLCHKTLRLPSPKILEFLFFNADVAVPKSKIHCHYHLSVMELDHLLTRSGLAYPEISSKDCHHSFCHLENSVSLPWVIYYKAFYLHAVSSFSCIPVICPKLLLFLFPL